MNSDGRGAGEEAVITAGDSPVKVFVIPTDEELVCAEDVAAILAGKQSDHCWYDYAFAPPVSFP